MDLSWKGRGVAVGLHSRVVNPTSLLGRTWCLGCTLIVSLQ